MLSIRSSSARSGHRIFVALLALVALCATFAPQPARADGAASTRNIILGAAALATGIIIANNVAHKNAAANRVVGYTRDGGTIYGDGRVVYPYGRTAYLSNGDGRPCGYAGYGERCGGRPLAYLRRGGDGDDRRGWHRRPHRDRDDRGGGQGDRGD